MILFGSVARGDFRRDSDADALVVVEQPEQSEKVYEDCEGGVHPVVKTFDQMNKFIGSLGIAVIPTRSSGYELW